jgi:hypothetical protein
MAVSIFVCTPSIHLTPVYVASMEKLVAVCHDAGIQMGVYRESGDGIVRARNRSVAKFLTTDFTHLMFIDDDIGFQPNDVIAMASSGLDVVCGVYPKKAIDWQAVAKAVKQGVPDDRLHEVASPMCCNLLGTKHKALRDEKFPAYTFMTIKDGPTGFMCIKRETITKLIACYGDSIAFRGDWGWGSDKEKYHKIFHMDRDPAEDHPDGPYLSEDYWFCRQWQRMGGDIYALVECRLEHQGQHTFVGRLGDKLSERAPS